MRLDNGWLLRCLREIADRDNPYAQIAAALSPARSRDFIRVPAVPPMNRERVDCDCEEAKIPHRRSP